MKPKWYRREKKLNKETEVIRRLCNQIIHETYRMTDEVADPFAGVHLAKKCRRIENEVNNILISLNRIQEKEDPLVTPLFPPREE
jgi:hypothetical protein